MPETAFSSRTDRFKFSDALQPGVAHRPTLPLSRRSSPESPDPLPSRHGNHPSERLVLAEFETAIVLSTLKIQRESLNSKRCTGRSTLSR
jgi:hypothetical protein